MNRCSLHRELQIVPGDIGDYRRLAAYHYRNNELIAVKAVYVAQADWRLCPPGQRAVGVIVYTMPNPRVHLRRIATAGRFAGLDRQTELALLNRNVRCIARVVVEPRFRGIGLATRLVRETMPRLNVPIIEALAVMPRVNPFLERAGLTAFAPRVGVEHVALLEAFSLLGIEEDDLVDAAAVQRTLDRLSPSAARFLEARIEQFLKSHGRRRTLPPGPERTGYLLGKLTHRPAYYAWFHPDLEVTLP